MSANCFSSCGDFVPQTPTGVSTLDLTGGPLGCSPQMKIPRAATSIEPKLHDNDNESGASDHKE